MQRVRAVFLIVRAEVRLMPTYAVQFWTWRDDIEGEENIYRLSGIGNPAPFGGGLSAVCFTEQQSGILVVSATADISR